MEEEDGEGGGERGEKEEGEIAEGPIYNFEVF